VDEGVEPRDEVEVAFPPRVAVSDLVHLPQGGLRPVPLQATNRMSDTENILAMRPIGCQIQRIYLPRDQ
jgi:hypothetical protein